MCDYCENRKMLGHDGEYDEIYIEHLKEIGVKEMASDTWRLQINYCPMCGKKLNNWHIE